MQTDKYLELYFFSNVNTFTFYCYPIIPVRYILHFFQSFIFLFTPTLLALYQLHYLFISWKDLEQNKD